MSLRTHRDAIRDTAPRWLQGTWGGRLLYSLALVLDGMGDALAAGLKMRFPGLYSTESLPLIGRERRIVRGPGETDGQFAARLRMWLDSHRRAGNPFALLEQLRAYLLPENPSIVLEVINRNGVRYLLSNSGEASVFTGETWDWDNHPDQWSRFWVVLNNTKWDQSGITWGSATWGDGSAWGCDATPAEVTGVRNLVKAWTPPHAKCENVVVVFDAFGFSLTPPDGTWDYHINRSPAAAYWGGT